MLRSYISILFFVNNASTAINFAASLVLARLLTPGDVGIYSMTVVFVNIMHTFRDFGIGAYLIREKTLTPENIKSAFGLLLATSWSVSAFLFFIATPLARMYNTPEVAEVMRVLASGFLLIPFGAVTLCLLKRNLDAKSQAIALTTSTFTYTGACIVLAANGAGYMTMAWANLINIIVCNLVYAKLRPAGIPWLPSFKKWGSVARFSGGAALANLVGNINNSLPDLLIGRTTNPETVGLYSRGNGMVELFSLAVMPAVNNATLPALSRRFHAGEPIVDDLCLSASYLSALAWPFLIVSATYAVDIIRLLYGENWVAAAVVVPWLCLASAAKISLALTTNALVAVGRPYISIVPALSTLCLRFALPVAFQASDLVSFAICFFASDLIACFFSIAVWKKALNVPLKRYLFTVLHSLIVCVPTMAICIGAFIFPPTASTVANLAIVCTLSLASWYFSVTHSNHPLSNELGKVRKILAHKLKERK